MPYTLGEAARATGVSKSTLSRAVKAGTISAGKSRTGSFVIEPAELHRVFPPAVLQNGAETPALTQPATLAATPDTPDLRRENELLREMLGDLQRRLDREGEERRQAQTQLMALLADQRRPWWRRLRALT